MLTAEQLEITQAEYDALLKVRDTIGALKHIRDPNCTLFTGNTFNMGTVTYTSDDPSHCGTCQCIGGWLYTFMINVAPNKHGVYAVDPEESRWYVSEERSPILYHLFYPLSKPDGRWMRDDEGKELDYDYNLITPEQAVQAINNFLTKRDARWDIILLDNHVAA